MKQRWVLVFMLGPPIAAAAAQTQLRPGEYELALEIIRTVSRGAHYEAGFDKDKKVECFTADQLKGPAEIARLFASEVDEAHCTKSDVKTSRNRMTIATTCQDQGVSTALKSELTFSRDLIAIVTEVRDDRGTASTVRVTAKRLGACKQAP